MASILQAAETPLAVGIVAEGGVQAGAIKFRPTLFGDPQFRIGNLPEEEVADTQLARRADKQVRVRHPTRIQRVAHSGFVDTVRIERAPPNLLRNPPHL